MNRAKGIGPVAPDLVADALGERRRPRRPSVEVGRRLASQADGSGPSSAPTRPTSRIPGPDERVAAEQHRDRGGRRPPPSGRAATGRRSGRGAGGPTRSGPRAPAMLASSAPRRWARSTRVSMIAASASAAEVRPERRRAVAVEQRPEDRGGRPLPGHAASAGPAPRRARASARPSGARASASVAADVRPATSSSRPASAATPRIASIRDRHGPRSIARCGAPRRPGDAGQHEVERAVEVDREAPAAAQVGDRVAGVLGEPAGQGVVAGEIGHGGEALGRARHGDDVGRVAVVGEGPPVVGAGGRRRTLARSRASPAGSRRSPGRRARRRAIGADQVPEPSPERCIVGRPGHDPDVVGAGRDEARSGAARPARPARRRASARADRRPAPDPGGGCGRRPVASRESIGRHRRCP